MKVLTKYVPYTRTTGCERRGREMRRPTVYSLRRLVPLALTLCVLLGAVLLCTACSRGTPLSAPTGTRLDEITLTLSWNKVKGAAYYTVRIRPDDGSDAVEKDASKPSLSLESLTEGSYELRVRAVAGGSAADTEDSGWSEPIRFTREHETGLAFRLIEDGTAFEVSGLGTATGEITVPDTYRGLPVTAIGERALYNKNTVTGVTLGENIRRIGKQAFANCSYMTHVNLPSGLTEIGDQAFQSCRALEVPMQIPDGLSAIGEQVFAYCRKLPAVSLGAGVKEIGNGAFSGCESLTAIVIPDQITRIGEDAFAKCTAVTSLSVGQGVTEIGKNAFRQNTALPAVRLGEHVRTVGAYAFADCTALRTLDMTDSVTAIGESAFSGCSGLTSAGVLHLSTALDSIAKEAFKGTAFWEAADMVYLNGWLLACKSGDMTGKVIEPGTFAIADYALAGCKGFADITILPDSVILIGEGAFSGCKTLTGLVIGSGVRRIGNKAFANCTSLSHAILGAYDPDADTLTGASALTYIGDSAFSGCGSLLTVSLPETVTDIGSFAFRNAGLWTSAKDTVYAGNWLVGCKEDAAGDVTIADGTVGIANYAFYNCKFIGGVIIPDSVRSIGRGAFYNCRKLASATLPAGLTVLEDYTFYHCDALTLPTLPATLTGIGRSAFYKCALGEQSNDTAQDTLVIPDSVTYIGAFAFYGSGYSYADPDKVDTYIAGGIDILVIGSGVQTVGEQAFANFPSLRRVTLGAEVRSLGDKAFYKCTMLETVDFGNSRLESIGGRAFYKCAALTEITLPETLRTVGDYAFYKCTSLTRLSLGGAERIGDYAFSGCTALAETVLPDTLTSIGRQAFRNCTSLSGLVLGNTLQSIGEHAFYGCRGLTLYAVPETAPAGWDARWNSSYRPVLYGCQAEDGVLSGFTKRETATANFNETTSVTAPVRIGYGFAGFATEAGGTAVYAAADFGKIPEGTALFPVWTDPAA